MKIRILNRANARKAKLAKSKDQEDAKAETEMQLVHSREDPHDEVRN